MLVDEKTKTKQLKKDNSEKLQLIYELQAKLMPPDKHQSTEEEQFHDAMSH